jgi:uncharacterized protein involved in cysteine biosynthesis
MNLRERNEWMDKLTKYLSDTAHPWIAQIVAWLIAIAILFALFSIIFKTIKGTLNIDFWGIKFQSDTLSKKLQAQVSDLTEINAHKAQVLKLLNQTILTVPKWERA